MANFGGKDAVLAKPYLAMVADVIRGKKKIKIAGKSVTIKNTTPEIKNFVAAIKSNKQNKINDALKDGNSFKPIFNGYKWTQIDKAPFSGSGGSGGGAEVTALTESLQCFYCSLAINIKGKLKPSDITKANLEAAGKYVDADRTLKQCMEKGPADWVEGGVYIKTANTLYDKYKSKFQGKVYFHRGSGFMAGVYDAKKKCHANDKKSAIQQAPGSFGDDKWNPGDIWATTFPSSARPLKDFTDSWSVLNAEVARLSGILGGRTQLLGISLKKASAPKITQYRDPSSKKTSSAKYTGFIYGRGDFFSSQDIYLEFTTGRMQCRTFNGIKSWQGEIKQKEAAGGKIGGGNLDFYSKAILGKSVYGSFGTESRLYSNVNLKSEKFIKEFYELYAETNPKQMKSTETLSYNDFAKKLKEKDLKFINSKYTCLYLAHAILSAPSTKRNEFVDAIAHYAGSNTDQSSFYIKIS